MQIPRFWVPAEGSARDPQGKPWHVKVWGWSSTSVAEATDVAAARLEQALHKVGLGQVLNSATYYPRVPVREETLREIEVDGDLVALVTRNRYGAQVLNTEAVLVADIDVQEPPAIARFVRRLFGRGDPAPLNGPDAASAPDGPVAAALAQITTWAAGRPNLGVRVYRTAAGLRVLVTGLGAPAASPEARAVLVALGSDPLYVELCQQHGTYRARLTPKPWRVGIRSRRISWPPESDREAARTADWVERYERASEGYATCRLVQATGYAPATGSPESVVCELHDDVSRARSDRPLA